MTDPNYTHIMVLLDRSGSMVSIREAMEDGFNRFISEQRDQPGACTVSLARFDDEYVRVYSARPISDVPPLLLEPRGATALHDALCRMIDEEGKMLSGVPEARRPGRVLCLVISDGEENSSHIYGMNRRATAQAVRQRIETQRGTYGWQFVFLGTSEAQLSHANLELGINIVRGYKPDNVGVHNLYTGISASTSNYRSGGQF